MGNTKKVKEHKRNHFKIKSKVGGTQESPHIIDHVLRETMKRNFCRTRIKYER